MSDQAAIIGATTWGTTLGILLAQNKVPVNLLAAIQFVGFDFAMSPKMIGDRVVAGSDLVAEQAISVTVQ